jgi:hypothetical protein
MKGNNLTNQKMFRKKIQQVLQVKCLMLYNVIELTYNDDKDSRYRTKGSRLAEI